MADDNETETGAVATGERPKMISFRPSAETDDAINWMIQYAVQQGIPPHRVKRSEIIRIAVRHAFVNWAAMVAQLPKWY